MQLLINKYIQNNTFDFLCNVVLEAETVEGKADQGAATAASLNLALKAAAELVVIKHDL